MFDVDIWKPLDDFFNSPSAPRVPFVGLKLDIQEEDDKYVIHADVPGYEKDDISIELTDGILSISACKSEEKDIQEKNYIRKERYHGKVSRSVSIGDNVDEDAVKASLAKGILTVTIPKKEPEKKEGKKITIE